MEKEMTVIGHLSELRRRLIIVAVFFIAILIAGFYLAPDLLIWIKQNSNAGNIVWNVFGFTDGIMIYLKCAMLVSILCTLPVLFYQAWRFVRPALTETEAKNTFWYVPISFFLFLIGAAFAYFVVFPLLLQFMSSINQSIGAVETYGIDKYLTFMFNTVFPVSLVFEMPLVILFLTRIGLLNPDILRKSRKGAYLILVFIALLITPPDFISDIVVSVPLIVLFEVGILISARAVRKQKREGM